MVLSPEIVRVVKCLGDIRQLATIHIAPAPPGLTHSAQLRFVFMAIL